MRILIAALLTFAFSLGAQAHTGGITGVSLLSESHIACHTFPEYASLCLNIFCCRPRAGDDFEALLKQHLGAAHVSIRKVDRPYQS